MNINICANTGAGFSAARVEDILARACGDGEIIHSGRNQIWKVENGGDAVTVKRFSRSLKNRILYSARKSKARKSYDNAVILRSRGISTPEPCGYKEIRGVFNTLVDSYYICRYEESLSLRAALERYGDECMTAFASFVARLHEQGIRHDDLNNTNVRVRVAAGGQYEFSLIDLNRMKIYPEGASVPPEESFRNICRFGYFDDSFRLFVGKYTAARSMDWNMAQQALAVKERHERRIERKKKFKRLISNKTSDA